MAQTGFTPILLYASNTATSVPAAGNLTNSANGAEVAVNTADRRLFTKNSGGSVVELGTNPSALTVAGTTTLSALTASTALALNASKEVVSVTNTGTGNNVLSNSPALTTPNLGTPSAATLTNATGLPLTTGVTGTLAASNGGTGQSTYTTGDLLYATGATTLAKLGIGTNGQILTSTGTAPQWSTLSGVAVTTFSAGTTGFTPSTATSGAVTLAGTLATTNGGTGLTSFTANRVFYASSTSAVGQSANLTFDGTTLTAAGFSGPLNGSVGASTPSTGAFTTLSASSTVTLSGGTANGVLYLNGSKVATSGSALTFDGTVFGVSTAGTTVGSFTGASTAIPGTAGFWNNAVAGIDLFDSAGSAGFGVGIRFRPNNGGTYPVAGIAALAPNTTSSNLVFHVQDLNGSVPEQMRLTSTGLGIGTSSPNQKLSVISANPTNGYVASLSNSQSSAGRTGTYLLFDAPLLADWKIGIPPDVNAFSFYDVVAGTERMRLDTSGNLGLGVTPSAWDTATFRTLQVGSGVGSVSLSGRTDGGKDLVLGSNIYYGTGSWRYVGTDVATSYRQDNGNHSWYTAPSGTAGNTISFTQAMTLDASGNLLVGGTSVYVSTMTSYGTSSRSAGLGLRNSAGTAAGGIFTYAAGSGGGSTDVIVESTGYLGFYAGGATERARITSTGNVVAGGSVALATTATDGFLYVPTCAGTPTGTPTAITGMAPIVVDTTNNKMYFYSGGAWRDAGP